MTALLWGGRFGAPPDADLLAFASSFQEDLVIAPFDLLASTVHVRVLERAGIVTSSEATILEGALHAIGDEIASGTSATSEVFEDVHSAIDARLCGLVGAEVGGKLHTGRSRNDQVATAIALYARAALTKINSAASDIVADLLDRAESELHSETLLVGTTHGQPAQPILLAFWLHAAAVGLARQVRRSRAVRDGIDRCPLGAAALAGSSLALDRTFAASALEFSAGPTENALDTVGDRDVVLDALFACSTLLIHLSRIATELVGWCSPLVGFGQLGDNAATGSSAMPQKRNPDVFELVRAKASTVSGLICAVLGQLKGLPLSYHRDLQESKRALIAGLDETEASLRAFRNAFASYAFHHEQCNASAADSFACSTDLVEQLVLGGIPCRSAHRSVGERIKAAEVAGLPLTDDDGKPLDALASVRNKATLGSTNPQLLARAIAKTRASLTVPGGVSE